MQTNSLSYEQRNVISYVEFNNLNEVLATSLSSNFHYSFHDYSDV